MDAWSYISIVFLVTMVLAALLVLRYRLFPTWKDVWKGFSDGDYFLAFHLHRRFRRQVLSGKQRYDRYVQQMNSAFLNQYSNPKKSPFNNDQENTRRSRMREMLENESFIREHFKDEPFGFQNWQQMLDAWNLTPITASPITPESEQPHAPAQNIEDTQEDFLLPLDKMFSGKAPQDLKDRIETLFDRKAPTGKEMAVIIAVLQHHCYFKFSYSNKDIVQAFSNTTWKRNYTFKAYSTVMDYLKDDPREYLWGEFKDIEKRLCEP